MSNLPPTVSVGDSDAPWNQEHPTPDLVCRDCGHFDTKKRLGSDNECPNGCGEMDDY